VCLCICVGMGGWVGGWVGVLVWDEGGGAVCVWGLSWLSIVCWSCFKNPCSHHQPNQPTTINPSPHLPYHLKQQVTQQKDILDGGEDDEDDQGWFVGGLKFKRHVDDAFRTDDYVTIPSQSQGPPRRGVDGGGGAVGRGEGGRW
jgi:hypothetical protein